MPILCQGFFCTCLKSLDKELTKMIVLLQAAKAMEWNWPILSSEHIKHNIINPYIFQFLKLFLSNRQKEMTLDKRVLLFTQQNLNWAVSIQSGSYLFISTVSSFLVFLVSLLDLFILKLPIFCFHLPVSLLYWTCMAWTCMVLVVGGATSVSLRSCQELLPCLAEPMPTGSRMDPPRSSQSGMMVMSLWKHL